MANLDKETLDDFDVEFNDNNSNEALVEDDILADIDIDFDDDETSEEQAEELVNDIEIEEDTNEDNTSESDIVNDAEENSVETEENNEESSETVNISKEEIVEEPVNNKKDKKKKKKLFGKEEVDIKPIDLILYIIADKANVGMTSYCRNYGANVSKVFTNIAEARDNLLMQIEPFRVIVIDSGTGKFTNMGTRKELIDLLGICDVDTRITVFYTDSAIKTDVELADGVEDKEITWIRYKSTPDVVAHILQNSKKEHYVLDANDYEEPVIDDSMLNFKGLKVVQGKQLDLGKPTITPDDVILHMMNNNSEEGLLQSYNIKIRR